MNNAFVPLMATFLSLMVGFLFLSLFTMAFSYKERMKERYDFLSMFPYEGFEVRSAHGHYAVGLWVMYLLSLAGSFSILLMCPDIFPFLMGREITVGITGGLMAIAIAGLTFTDASNMKVHIFCFVLYAIALMLNGLCVGFAFLDLRVINETLGMVFAVITFTMAGLSGVVILNPKLSSWGNLKKVGEGESAIYVRPRPFLLPFSEWILIGMGLLLSIVTIIGDYLLILQK